jgi:hypothetical protein
MENVLLLGKKAVTIIVQEKTVISKQQNNRLLLNLCQFRYGGNFGL